MTPRALVLLLAGAAAIAVPAAAQLRATPQLGSARPAADSGPRAADFIVAVVNSEPITNNEVRARLLRFEQQLTQQGAAMPSRTELNRVVLERLISERAQLQLARESGVRVDDATVDQAEQSFARQNQVDVPELRRRLAVDGISLATFRDDLRSQLLLSRVRDREVEQRVRVTDQEAEQFLREQQQGAGADQSQVDLNLAQVLVAVPENAPEPQVQALRAKADDVLRRARGGEDFTKLAREVSEAQNVAANGGQFGLRPADRYPQLFLDAVQGLPEGGLSGVVQSGAGFHVLKVVERRQGGMAGASVTQNHARHILLRSSAQQSEAAARTRLAEYKRRIESRAATFEQLAREFSQDASSARGGDLGWTNPGQFVPEFEEALSVLQPGEIADPVTSRFGVHLIQLMERRQATLSAREQREVARNMLREKKVDEAYLQWAQEVRGRAYVEYREAPQ
jgi:peptidyl-prolyl cis-trans isomerase SurA